MDTRRYSMNDYMAAHFFQLPKWLFKGKYEKMLTNNERILYAILKERFSISIANQWTDEAGNIFFFYKQQELAECSCLHLRTVQRSIKKLKEAGLLDEERSGANIPNRLYLLKPECEELTDKECMQGNTPSDRQPEAENEKTEEKERTSRGENASGNGHDKLSYPSADAPNCENGHDRMSYPSAGASNCENGHDIMLPRTRQIVMPDTTDCRPNDTTDCRPNNTELINKKELINNQYQYHNHDRDNISDTDYDTDEYIQAEKFNTVLEHLKNKVSYNDSLENRENLMFEKTIADEILSMVTAYVYMLPPEKTYNIKASGVMLKVKNDTVKSVFEKHLNSFVFMSYIRQFITGAKKVTNPTAYHIAGLYKQCIEYNSRIITGYINEENDYE